MLFVSFLLPGKLQSNMKLLCSVFFAISIIRLVCFGEEESSEDHSALVLSTYKQAELMLPSETLFLMRNF